MANYSYVKFQRGTLNAFNNLRTKDPDTLYFIYADANNQYGSLYLGEKLISGGEVTVVSSSLIDLTDTQLSNIQDGQILVYDSSVNKWKNFNLATAIENAGVQTGATVNNITPAEGQTDAEALEGISNPSAGDIAFVEDNIYIYNGSEWKEIAGVSAETPQRNIWTLNGPLRLSRRAQPLTQEAEEKMAEYGSSSEEFMTWAEEHSDQIEWITTITVRVAELTDNDQSSVAIGDIVLAQDLEHPTFGNEINSIYQVIGLDSFGILVTLKSLLQGTQNVEERISNLENLVGQPASGTDSATGLHAVIAEKISTAEVNQLIAAAVENLNHLSYQKVNNLNDIILDAEDADRYIYLVPQDVGSINDAYDEYLVINNTLEKMGQWGDTNLENVVSNLNTIINGTPATEETPAMPGLADRVSSLETTVGDITQLFNYDSENPTTIINAINEINERLIWGEMENPNEGN